MSVQLAWFSQLADITAMKILNSGGISRQNQLLVLFLIHLSLVRDVRKTEGLIHEDKRLRDLFTSLFDPLLNYDGYIEDTPLSDFLTDCSAQGGWFENQLLHLIYLQCRWYHYYLYPNKFFDKEDTRDRRELLAVVLNDLRDHLVDFYDTVEQKQLVSDVLNISTFTRIYPEYKSVIRPENLAYELVFHDDTLKAMIAAYYQCMHSSNSLLQSIGQAIAAISPWFSGYLKVPEEVVKDMRVTINFTKFFRDILEYNPGVKEYTAYEDQFHYILLVIAAEWPNATPYAGDFHGYIPLLSFLIPFFHAVTPEGWVGRFITPMIKELQDKVKQSTFVLANPKPMKTVYSRLKEYYKQAHRLVNDLAKAQYQVSNARDQMDLLVKTQAVLMEENQSLEDQLSSRKDPCDERIKKIEESHKKEMDALDVELKKLQRDKDDLNQRLQDAMKQANEAKQQHESILEELERQKEAYDQQVSKGDVEKDQLERMRAELEHNKELFKQLDTQHADHIRDLIDRHQEENNLLEKRYNQLIKEHEENVDKTERYLQEEFSRKMKEIQDKVNDNASIQESVIQEKLSLIHGMEENQERASADYHREIKNLQQAVRDREEAFRVMKEDFLKQTAGLQQNVARKDEELKRYMASLKEVRDTLDNLKMELDHEIGVRNEKIAKYEEDLKELDRLRKELQELGRARIIDETNYNQQLQEEYAKEEELKRQLEKTRQEQYEQRERYTKQFNDELEKESRLQQELYVTKQQLKDQLDVDARIREENRRQEVYNKNCNDTVILLRKQLDEIVEEIKRHQQEEDRLKAALEQAKTDYNNKLKEADTFIKELKKTNEELSTNHQFELQKLRDECEAYKNNINKFQMDLNTKQKEIEGLKTRLFAVSNSPSTRSSNYESARSMSSSYASIPPMSPKSRASTRSAFSEAHRAPSPSIASTPSSITSIASTRSTPSSITSIASTRSTHSHTKAPIPTPRPRNPTPDSFASRSSTPVSRSPTPVSRASTPSSSLATTSRSSTPSSFSSASTAPTPAAAAYKPPPVPSKPRRRVQVKGSPFDNPVIYAISKNNEAVYRRMATPGMTKLTQDMMTEGHGTPGQVMRNVGHSYKKG